MAGENEPAKLLLPYLQRADELQKHEPLVAYYCRLYAMERGLKFPANERTKTTKSLLASLMNQLEKDKKSLKLSPDDHLHLEGFALNVFSKADKQDRAGRADINTAKTFYAASIFFEILNQFGEIAPDLEQKQKYAVWKAADIRKALKEGRKPVPGPPGGEADDLPADIDPSSAPVGGQDIETRDTVQNINPHPEPDIPPSLQFPDGLTRQPSNNIPPSPPSFASADYPTYTSDYPSHDYQSGHSSGGIDNPMYPQPHHSQSGHSSGGIDNPTYPQPHRSQSGHSSGGIDNPMYPQPHHSQSYAQDPQHLPHVQQNYPSQDIPTSYSYPNFQSYPSFAESSLPAAPSHYPSYYQGSDASYSQLPDPSLTSHALAPQYSSNGRIGNVPEAPPTTQMYHYDSNYQVPPEKISEAQKAARFAVGALAFDEVPVAVEHLRKALELLTNPSAGH